MRSEIALSLDWNGRRQSELELEMRSRKPEAGETMNDPKPSTPPPAPPSRPQGQNIQIELPEKEAEGIYANLALITHSPSEVVIDFARVLPNVPKSKVYARVVMTPYNAKALLLALDDNLKKYESQFGPIKLMGQADNRSIGF
jgi:Protein of unknown function (DUF3467)